MQEELQPGRDELRKFAWVMAAAVIVFFAILLPWIFSLNFPLWPWLLGLVLVAWGLLAPLSLLPFYRAWMRFGMLIHRVTTPLILGILFFLVITPIACLMKLVSGSTMPLSVDRNSKSYWINSKQRKKEDMEKPF